MLHIVSVFAGKGDIDHAFNEVGSSSNKGFSLLKETKGCVLVHQVRRIRQPHSRMFVFSYRFP